MDLNLETAKAYATSVKAPLQWVIAALFMEEIVNSLSKSEINNSSIIGGDYVISSVMGADYQVLPILEFFIANDKKNLLLEIIENTQFGILKIKKILQTRINQALKEDYVVEGSLEGIRTSFVVKLKIYDTESPWGPRKPREMRGYTGLNRMDGVYCLCTEENLVDKLNNIVSSGEIINNMRDYYDLGRIVTTVNLDGHRLIECLDRVEVRPEELVGELEALSSNNNLHKRWRAWSRDNHINNFDYMDIFKSLKMIFSPLVSSYMANEVFFGEWVPELNRFIG